MVRGEFLRTLNFILTRQFCALTLRIWLSNSTRGLIPESRRLLSKYSQIPPTLAHTEEKSQRMGRVSQISCCLSPLSRPFFVHVQKKKPDSASKRGCQAHELGAYRVYTGRESEMLCRHVETLINVCVCTIVHAWCTHSPGFRSGGGLTRSPLSSTSLSCPPTCLSHPPTTTSTPRSS